MLTLNIQQNSISAKLLLAFTVFALNLSFALLLTGSNKGLLAAGAFTVIITAALYLKYPVIFLYFLIGYLFLGNFFLTKLSINLPMKGYIDEVMAFGVLGMFLVRKWTTGQQTKFKWVEKYLFLFVIAIAASAFINAVHPVTTLNLATSILKPFALFYVIIESPFDKKQLKSLVIFISIIGAVQCFTVLSQFAAGKASGLHQAAMMDVGKGTLSAGLQHHVGYFLLVLCFTFSGLYLNTKRRVFLFGAFFFGTGFLLANAYHALLLVPAVLLLFTLLTTNKGTVKSRIIMLLLIPIFLFVTVQISGNRRVESIASFEKIKKTGKFISYYNLFFKLPNELSIPGLFFGAGPGMYASEIAIKKRPPLFIKYVYNITASWGHDPRASVTNHPWTSVIAFLGELGIIGFTIFFLFFIRIFKEVRARYMDEAFPAFWKGLAFGVLCSLIFLGLLSFVNTAFEDMFLTYPVMALTAAVMSVTHKTPDPGGHAFQTRCSSIAPS